MLETKGFRQAKEVIQRATKLQIEMTQLDALICIYEAGEKGISLTDLAKKIGVSLAAAGRTAATFSTHGYRGSKMGGWGVAETFTDYANPKYKMVRLLPKGKAVIEEFLTVLGE